MSNSDLEAALADLDRNTDKVHFTGPASSAAVAEAERALGVRFPPSYRAFVERYGAGSIAGRELYGVLDDPVAPGPPNVVWVTERARQDFGLPRQFVVLVDFDDSSAVALDSSLSASDGEQPVLRIWPGEPGDVIDSELARDFGAFLKRFVDERLEMTR